MQVKHANRLINEKSPYLLQHAHNPVDWYPWGDEAFAKAKKEDKPVFLSIGYSTCHWCHVMERESFEDREVADILNQNYIAIKVDREERPDIDTIYMAVCQAMTGQGGWPLTVIMTPDKKPFFAGTYFPKNSFRGMPGLMDILENVSQLWKTDRQQIISSSDKISEAVQQSMFSHDPGEIGREALDGAYRYFAGAFDETFGGFGRAPKFPSPHNLSFLLRYWKLTGEAKALAMVEKTLDVMYLGGIYDHIGFGFARYSTDRRWLVPHFEKMLYDNALLAIAYLEACQATGSRRFAAAAEEIFTYVLRDMTSPQGAFYSAEDADSEGEEGKFYVWTPDEIKEVLGDEEGGRFCRDYDISPGGNFEGQNIPNLIKTGYTGGFAEARARLFRHREQRIHPFKDDKVLTAWNGLMIAALGLAARVLDKPAYSQAAEKAVDFIMSHLRRPDGRLLARHRDGEAAFPAYAEDYAYLIWGLIELFQATARPSYLETALVLTGDMLKYFWDNKHGGLFHYGSDAESLIARPKETYDGALPSANSVAALNFLRLARLTGSSELAEKAHAQFAAFGGSVSQTPMGHTHFLMAVWLDLIPAVDVTILGSPAEPIAAQMLRAVNSGFRPELTLLVKTPDRDDTLEALAPELQGKTSIDGKATAYVCRSFACQPPTTDPKQLAALLDQP